MKKQLAKLVNSGLAGEPENIVLQIIDTLEIVEFSKIKHIDETGVIRDVVLIDNTLEQPEILHILNSLGHEVNLSFDENKVVTLYF